MHLIQHSAGLGCYKYIYPEGHLIHRTAVGLPLTHLSFSSTETYIVFNFKMFFQIGDSLSYRFT